MKVTVKLWINNRTGACMTDEVRQDKEQDYFVALAGDDAVRQRWYDEHESDIESYIHKYGITVDDVTNWFLRDMRNEAHELITYSWTYIETNVSVDLPKN